MIQDDVTYSTRIDLVDLHHHLRISEESRFLVRTRVANLVNPSSKFTPTHSTFLTKLHSTYNINIYITHNSKCAQLKSLYLSLSRRPMQFGIVIQIAFRLSHESSSVNTSRQIQNTHFKFATLHISFPTFRHIVCSNSQIAFLPIINHVVMVIAQTKYKSLCSNPLKYNIIISGLTK